MAHKKRNPFIDKNLLGTVTIIKGLKISEVWFVLETGLPIE